MQTISLYFRINDDFAGRHKYLEALEIHVDEIARAGNALAISEISVRFRYFWSPHSPTAMELFV